MTLKKKLAYILVNGLMANFEFRSCRVKKVTFFWSDSASWVRVSAEILIFFLLCKSIYMLGILKKSEVTQIKFILLVASDFKMAATTKPAIRGQKYFGWVTFSMKW